jgi:hypothetical protein
VRVKLFKSESDSGNIIEMLKGRVTGVVNYGRSTMEARLTESAVWWRLRIYGDLLRSTVMHNEEIQNMPIDLHDEHDGTGRA